jgi:hypothetical protein
MIAPPPLAVRGMSDSRISPGNGGSALALVGPVSWVTLRLRRCLLCSWWGTACRVPLVELRLNERRVFEPTQAGVNGGQGPGLCGLRRLLLKRCYDHWFREHSDYADAFLLCRGSSLASEAVWLDLCGKFSIRPCHSGRRSPVLFFVHLPSQSNQDLISLIVYHVCQRGSDGAVEAKISNQIEIF